MHPERVKECDANLDAPAARLEKSDLRYRTVNIWEDEEGRAFVRSVARGNETVPTVAIGSRALVNPSMREIEAAASG